jgi:23S rRNA pseudouridine955/2504/2580 synthase
LAQVETRTVERDEAGMRLDRWFHSHYPTLSFGHLQKLLRSGQVRVDGKRAKSNARLEPGQQVRVPPLGDLPAETKPRPPGGSGGELRQYLLYEDDAVLVFNKPAGLAVQGGSGLTRHVDAMLEEWRDRKGQKPRLVHRLDRETSGVLVVARTRLAASRLAAAFRSRRTKKVYWALVAGVPKPKQGRISTWLAKESRGEVEKMAVVEHGTDEASHAVTLYSVVDQVGTELAWLTMRPVTGRTHQLRAQAAHIGHPIIGDPLYFDRRDWTLPGGMQNRLHLHARRIVVPHPDGGVLDVTAPLPPHMVQSWNLLGFDAELKGAAELNDAA